MNERGRQRGLTLVEMLVALMIAGFALALAAQSLGQWRRAQERVATTTQAGRETRMVESWLRDSIRGLVAIADNRFEGDARGFAGMTLTPVLQAGGTPQRQRWRLDDDATLTLEEAGKVVSLPQLALSRPRFTYLDADGKAHDRWPPALGQHPPLPAAIGLQFDSARGQARRVVLAAILAPGPRVTVPHELEAD